MENVESVVLKGGSVFITEDPSDAIRIIDGAVYIYIVPYNDGIIGRRTLICEAQKGEVLPSFCFRDMDYQTWAFCLVAAEEASISIMKGMSTRPLKERFAARIGMDNLKQEGFENGLVDMYRLKLVREDGFFMRTGMEKRSTVERTDELIASVFSSEQEEEKNRTGNDLYDCIAELCSSEKIHIAPYEKIRACCGDEADVEDIARISHFPCRKVVLNEGWFNMDSGAILAFRDDTGKPVACVKRGTHRYWYCSPGEKRIALNRAVSERISPSAYVIYPSFPQGDITVGKLVRFCAKGLRTADVLLIVVLTLLSSLIGMLLPMLNQMFYDLYIPTGERAVIMQMGFLFASFMIGNLFFTTVRNICSFRMKSSVSIRVQNAVYHKVFSLPENFFRGYDSADLAGRAMSAGQIAGTGAGIIVASGISAVGLICYIVQMFSYSSSMALLAVVLFIVYCAVVMMISTIQLKNKQKALNIQGKTDSVMFQLLGGIEKIRTVGVEDRALYEYMKPFVKERTALDKANCAMSVSDVVQTALEALFLVVLYIAAYNSTDITTGSFVAFNSAFAAALAAITALVDYVVTYRMLFPEYDRIRPILECMPENTESRELLGELDGSIDVEHLSFSYDKGQPAVLEDISVSIKPGEYVGIVGSSGSGKSTLLKLLLGFERPDSGKIYFNNRDIESLDIQELRKKFGVVLQDGKLIAGSIYDNIVITAPKADIKRVMETVSDIGLKKDIDQMPMGIHTVVSEDCSTISGGQQQRILIARAIVSRPKILFFDEATSALDNVTQAMVSDTLEQMTCTRIVIAHRLSTIKRCDRIIVLDNGRISEQGSYEQLMHNKGLFYELACRQVL